MNQKKHLITIAGLLILSSAILSGCNANPKVADLENKIEELEKKNDKLNEQVVDLTEDDIDIDFETDYEEVDGVTSATTGASEHYSEEKKKIVDQIIALKKQLKGSLTKTERLEIINQIKALSKQIGEVYQD
ncbi:hypothetical protein [Isobaculum melis]|uniref:Lipoprotein n=1 Tax=Isobaculum melis TaxID=142588 RepID=A0A1H9QHM2_9LACT|nr:hypothetical protein [Isobaculum melis]SER60016.1 hypothetical protein SAMN04488559_10287 [Isobaculum melis]